jgi:hypothetical protein
VKGKTSSFSAGLLSFALLTMASHIQAAGPRLACSVDTGAAAVGFCSAPAPSYQKFTVSAVPQASSGTYSYSSWVITPDATTPTIVSGCTQGSIKCVFTLPSSALDKEGSVKVTITDLSTGGQTTSTVSYFIGAVCGSCPPSNQPNADALCPNPAVWC